MTTYLVTEKVVHVSVYKIEAESKAEARRIYASAIQGTHEEYWDPPTVKVEEVVE